MNFGGVNWGCDYTMPDWGGATAPDFTAHSYSGIIRNAEARIDATARASIRGDIEYREPDYDVPHALVGGRERRGSFDLDDEPDIHPHRAIVGGRERRNSFEPADSPPPTARLYARSPEGRVLEILERAPRERHVFLTALSNGMVRVNSFERLDPDITGAAFFQAEYERELENHRRSGDEYPAPTPLGERRNSFEFPDPNPTHFNLGLGGMGDDLREQGYDRHREAGQHLDDALHAAQEWRPNEAMREAGEAIEALVDANVLYHEANKADWEDAKAVCDRSGSRSGGGGNSCVIS